MTDWVRFCLERSSQSQEKLMKTKGRWRRILRMLFIVSMVFVFSTVLIIYLQPKFIVKWLARHSPNVLYYVDTKAKVVALTIDDAPHPTVTPQLLDVLREHSAHATFFLIGDHIYGNEQILERMRLEGHELGNHLAQEYPSIRLSPNEFEEQLLEVDRLIGSPKAMKWFRPGSGWYNERMLGQAQSNGYRCALGSVYPYDTIISDTSIISTFITKKVFPGAIIIIHDGKDDRVRSVEVLKRVLPILKGDGYQVVTLSELISLKDMP